MTRLASENFDFWPISAANVGAVTEDNAHARSGPGCAACADAGFNIVESGLLVPVLGRKYFYRFACRISALPSKTLAIFKLLDSTGTILEVSVDVTGKVQLWNPIDAAHPAETTPFVEPEEWFVIEVMMKVNAEGKSVVSYRFNGVEQAAEQEMNFRNLGVERARYGNPGNLTTGATIYIDDLAMNDETGGGVDHTWPGVEPDAVQKLLDRYWGADIAETEDDPHPTEPAPYNEKIWDDFEAVVGREVGILHYSDPWHSEGGPVWDGWPGSSDASEKCAARGAIPMKSIGGPTEVIQKVNAGDYDADWVTWAEAARAFARPFFLRLWWEQNGTWFSWGRSHCTGAEYVEAWRRIHKIVAAIAPNCTFVWCPNALFDEPSDPWLSPVGSSYPGDDYVDWIGVDGYTGQNPNKLLGWRNSKAVFGQTYERAQEEAPDKPMMICETGCSEWFTKAGPEPPHKAEWIQQLLEHTVPYEMPNIRAVVWFNWYIKDGEVGDGRVDWPIQSSESAEEAFADAIADPHYIGPEGGAEALLDLAKVPPPGEEQVFPDSPEEAEDTPRTTWETVPKLRVPLQLAGRRLATVDQDSPDNVAACVYAILSFERGSRIEDPDFGVQDPTFSQMPVDVDEWLEQIAAYEPRAEVRTEQEVGDLIGAVLVDVGLVPR